MSKGDGQSFHIRAAALGDQDTLAVMHAASWRAGFEALIGSELTERAVAVRCSGVRWAALLGDGSTTIIAASGAVDVGFLQFDIGEEVAEIQRLYVIPEFWGWGAANALVDESFRLLRAEGIDRVVVWSAETSQARRFYEKSGFVFAGRTKESLILPDSCATATDWEYVRKPSP